MTRNACTLYPVTKVIEQGEGGYAGLRGRLPNAYDDSSVSRYSVHIYRLTTLHLPNDHSQITSYQVAFTEGRIEICRINVTLRNIGGEGELP